LKETLEPGEIQYYQKIGSEYLKIITSKTEATETAYKYAEELLNKYKKSEPELTALLEKLVGERRG
jgi:exosome complex RNA-binding protein Rrp42 (RNase PH superfamily)